MADQGATRRRDFEAALIARAWTDEGFAAELRRNPKAAIEREVGKMPDGITVQVVEESPTSICIVLPAKPKKSSELSEAELEAVAGGSTWGPPCCY